MDRHEETPRAIPPGGPEDLLYQDMARQLVDSAVTEAQVPPEEVPPALAEASGDSPDVYEEAAGKLVEGMVHPPEESRPAPAEEA